MVAIFPELAVEGGFPHRKQTRGFHFVALCLRHGVANRLLLHFFERHNHGLKTTVAFECLYQRLLDNVGLQRFFEIV
jgi:hypothetical protein